MFCPNTIHRLLKGGVFFLRNRKLAAIGQGDFKSPNAGDMLGVYEVAFVAAQQEIGVLRFQFRSGGIRLKVPFCRIQNRMPAITGTFDVEDGVRNQVQVGGVRAMKMDSPA